MNLLGKQSHIIWLYRAIDFTGQTMHESGVLRIVSAVYSVIGLPAGCSLEKSKRNKFFKEKIEVI